MRFSSSSSPFLSLTARDFLHPCIILNLTVFTWKLEDNEERSSILSPQAVSRFSPISSQSTSALARPAAMPDSSQRGGLTSSSASPGHAGGTTITIRGSDIQQKFLKQAANVLACTGRMLTPWAPLAMRVL